MPAGMPPRNGRSHSGMVQAASQPGGEWSLRLIDGIAHALSEIGEGDLRGLRVFVNEEIAAVPALLEWLDTAVVWELNRRMGSCQTLDDPRLTIRDQGTRESSLHALAVLYAELQNVVGVSEFLDVTAEALCTVDEASAAALLH